MPKAIKEPESLGERLKERRESLGLTIQVLAQEVQAPQKYIMGLEEDRYEVFSAKIYALGFLKKILGVLNFEGRGEFLKEFSNEWDVQMFRTRKELAPLHENRGEEPLVTPTRLGIAAGVLFLVLFLVFFGFRLTRFVGTPRLVIEEPDNSAAFEGPVIRVKGRTEKESRLTVNGRELKIDEVGNFSEEIELAAGLNSLEFLVQNRFGKESKEVRH